MIIDDLFEEIVERDLCTRCGACVGFCPHDCIGWNHVRGLPVKGSGCNDCNLCMEACPGKEVDFPGLRNLVFPGNEEEARESRLGYYRKIRMLHSRDETIRSGAASGGVITSLFLDLLQSGAVDGVLALEWIRKSHIRLSRF